METLTETEKYEAKRRKKFLDVAREVTEGHRRLIIMRGLPGSGKSYTAKKYAPPCFIFSTDDYWGEEYNFDITKLKEAHQWNQIRVAAAMAELVASVVVDNTNTTKWEMSKYEELAEKHDYEVVYVEPDSEWWKEFREKQKNGELVESDFDALLEHGTHNVPLDTLKKMASRWEEI